MVAAKPSLELVRSLTDEHVLRALMRHRRLTRAELAAETGISKPTAGESVRRLTERGLVADTGERTPGGRGRGRVGSYYALTAGTGVALAVSIAPEGIVAEAVDAYGDTVARACRPLDRPARPDQVAAALTAAAAELATATPRLAVVSAADPVDRATGRLIQLPDAPFLIGELDPVALLRPYVDGPVTVDNDVNWAARAEPGPTDFAYLYLGEGLGCAVVSDGEVKQGRTGLAGEIAHLLTVGPDNSAVRLIEVFGQLGLRQPDSTAIDVDRVLADSPTVRRSVGRAVSGAIAAIVALTDPELVVIGGSWGPPLLDDIAAAVADLPRRVPLRAATLTDEPALAGARADALHRLRAAIIGATT
ncbi:Sugar kinase of the NBD/HSP70 family, may contain an N-terminal HTH domain [Micromonospora pattaloongensis]|uniref:Sugar kinase of the NBD/HSP70 family, may contain an N-terminal HTH domain n=1 Tax=Micromonospora pattaloongensis TaxID=405436 RepID=A0A1H3JKK7_9ACTN|nr:ROK family transcriptional regulator [Micromonospora pattaloongensis]SDY40520.1 Sugar kinase of the NBD/HSP70 family, may contain an N-terminal HTH domain [Micromonospora pattaloongensis]